MYGDPEVLRSRVGDLREQAVDVRALADHLVARTEDLRWSGRAAEAMHRRVSDRAVNLRAVAAGHEAAAEALLVHAEAVELQQESIARIERRAAELGLAPGELPPSGHRDWLDVEVTGQ